ncbi:PREDICTED: myrosinase 1-like [Ceratosolen solmsi marchali]|uniref:Myrosinase 1-like n=1 Tax=Ceratosolen solmsi marchali TaxID=326594 RepID=A0AAJ6VLT9_9HYME|nr:PREDICTED: myrosinase 1-like [Ceratosolen solmsi marchali]
MFNILQNHIKSLVLLSIATTVIVILVVYIILSRNVETNNSDLDFPDGFLIGAGSSAFQIEGAWNTSGKSASEMDNLLHQKNSIFPNILDISSDSYHHYLEDVKALKFMGMNAYRFSLSWSRLLPTGYANIVNPDGVRYYHSLLDELEKNQIQPIVTIYHFDHPYSLEKFGAWTNEKIVEIFADYARFVFKEFGHRVKIFSTINEPRIVSMLYASNWLKSVDKRNHSAGYLCGHNLLKAHARAFHIYDEEFRPKYNGLIGIVLNCDSSYTMNPNDHELNNIMFDYNCGWFANPIFSSTGDYPETLKKRVAENSKFEGLSESRLPIFTDAWNDYIRGSSDYFGLNHYNTYLVSRSPKMNETIWQDDIGIMITYDPRTFAKYPQNYTVSYMRPYGIREVLVKIKDNYNNPLVLITESGVPSMDDLHDYSRIKYLYVFMEQVLYAIKKDKCNVKSYIIWSLIDGYEFFSNYVYGFGLIRVDFNDPNRRRTPKASAMWLKNVIAKKRLYFDVNEQFENVNF